MVRQLCCCKPTPGSVSLCSHGRGAVAMFRYKIVYANYWLEFSQHKLTGQLKIHYAEFSLTFIRHNIIARHINQPVSEVIAR